LAKGLRRDLRLTPWILESKEGPKSTPTEKEILATYEGVQAASQVISTEMQLLLAPLLLVLT